MAIDIRQIALEMPLKKQAFWASIWGVWVDIWELSGDERATLLQECTSQQKVGNKTVGKVDLKKMYPMLVVQSLHYPDGSTMPDKSDPNYSKYPGATDENGNILTPAADKPGALVFSMSDMALLNKGSGATLEKIAQPAAKLSGLGPEEIEEKNVESAVSQAVDTDQTTGSTIG